MVKPGCGCRGGRMETSHGGQLPVTCAAGVAGPAASRLTHRSGREDRNPFGRKVFRPNGRRFQPWSPAACPVGGQPQLDGGVRHGAGRRWTSGTGGRTARARSRPTGGSCSAASPASRPDRRQRSRHGALTLAFCTSQDNGWWSWPRWASPPLRHLPGSELMLMREIGGWPTWPAISSPDGCGCIPTRLWTADREITCCRPSAAISSRRR